MKVLAGEPWSWVLFEDAGVHYLSVVCGSVGLYSVEICLTPEEVASATCGDRTAADELARAVRLDPAIFSVRRIDGFGDRSDVSEATAAWRAAKAS